MMEIFTLITGIIYVVLEILQKKLMWVVGVLTSLAAMWVFFEQGLYASFGLNVYYLGVSFWGLYQWSKDRGRLAENQSVENVDEVIHLNRLPLRTVVVSFVVTVAGTVALAEVMELLENPMSYMDAAVAVLSAVATWWLTRSYLEQWWLWIVADACSAVLCAAQGLWWMVLLYAVYSLSAFYGLYHWKKKGIYL